MLTRDPRVDLRRISREAETVTGVTIDPGRPRGQHLSPEIGQQPMGRSIRWPLWTLAVVAVLVALILISVWAAQGGWG